MAYSISPIVGAALNEVNAPSKHVLGTLVKGNDGHDYIFAKSSGAIAASAACVLTEPAMTMAAGAGAWTSPAAMVAGDLAWFKRTAI